MKFLPIAITGFLSLTSAAAAGAAVVSVSEFSAREGYSAGPLHGQDGWIVVSGEGWVGSEPRYTGDFAVGLRGLKREAVIQREFSGFDAEPVVYVDLYLRPGWHTGYPGEFRVWVDAAGVAFERRGGSVYLKLWDNLRGRWIDSESAPARGFGLIGGSWHRLTVRLDREELLYGVYLDGRLVEDSIPLGLFDSGEPSLLFEAESAPETEAWIDSLFLSNRDPLPREGSPVAGTGAGGADEKPPAGPGSGAAGGKHPFDPGRGFPGNPPEGAAGGGLSRAGERVGEQLEFEGVSQVRLRVFTPLE